MVLTPAIKGQLTKARNSVYIALSDYGHASLIFKGERIRAVRAVFAKHLPAEQAKHATRKYLQPAS
jgi:hypothetical protein